jgi:CRP-like cAMP-binding protein
LIQSEEIVIKQGEEGTHFYMMVEGECHVILNQKAKHNVIYDKPEYGNKISTGCYFGEISLIHDCGRTASVITQTHCTFAVMCKESFLNLGQDFLNKMNCHAHKYGCSMKKLKQNLLR